ncbi:glycosyltransferase family 2 protein [Marinomonas pollencensis]|uniref:Glycosyl transferase family 2 n=1 Tax=Marinomonas pollencensis TaxID=491954 RepID=A0A3E0D7I2_9GAMM|nr:glycosyltransferase family 2 protein [Marinomonas pollencensis]REG77528.1 glycosyl transferase family 2 [Marinomonas pollencensis]
MLSISKILKRKKFLGLICRCKDESFISEFAEYYLKEGVDHLYIIDDNSEDKSIYEKIKSNKKITILYKKNIISNNSANELYKKIKSLFTWIIYVDADEFITTKRNKNHTIREEIKNNFSEVDCIKIPWVMMSSNNIKETPKSILNKNIWRWNHDKEHPNDIHKFRCRKNEIEVKCIFKTSRFSDIKDHHPITNKESKSSIVNSINKEEEELSPFYKNLNEEKIKKAYLVCYHYRIISQENNLNKLKNNMWYKNKGYTLNDLRQSDHAEVFDNHMSIKNNTRKIFIIGFNRCGTRSLHYLFKENGLSCIHWDSDNLVKTIEKNIKAGKKAFYNGHTVNSNVNSYCSYEDAQVFSDFTCHEIDKDAKDYYKKLDYDYPNSKFILNIRNVDDWIKSRKKHSNGLIVEKQKKYHNCSEDQLDAIWKTMWDKSIKEMKEYFSNRDNDFIIFDIDNDDIKKISDFLEDDFVLDTQFYTHIK